MSVRVLNSCVLDVWDPGGDPNPLLSLSFQVSLLHGPFPGLGCGLINVFT